VSVRRTSLVNAPIEDVWTVIADAYQMPRWWPGLERVEGVDEERFTQVFVSARRRTVRADFRVVASESPEAGERRGRRTWTQELRGTPFERVLQESITEVMIESAAEGATRVTIGQRHKLKGSSRLGALSMRRATGKRLDQALDGLTRILG
jgi:carbon monoxide dehydrogenase subunit G